MKRFVEGVDRGQSTLFPECLDDWIDEDNPVRVMTYLSTSLISVRTILAGSTRRRQGDPRIIPRIEPLAWGRGGRRSRQTANGFTGWETAGARLIEKDACTSAWRRINN